MPPCHRNLWGKDHPVVIFLGVFMLGFCDTNPQTVKILKVTEGGGGGSDSRVDPGGGWGQAQTS